MDEAAGPAVQATAEDDVERARHDVQAAIELGDRTAIAPALIHLGNVLSAAGRHGEAADAFEQAAASAASGGSPLTHARALANAGAALGRAGRPADGVRLSLAAAAAYDEQGDDLARSRVETNLAVLHRDLGELRPALQAARRAETLDPEPREPAALAERLLLQAELTAALGDGSACLALAAAATGAARRGDDELLGEALERQAALLLDHGDAATALPVCFEAFMLRRRSGPMDAVFRTTALLALVYQLLGRWPDALAALTDARGLALRLGRHADVALMQAGVAAAHVALGRPDVALAEAIRAVDTYRALADPVGLGRALVTLGQCLAVTGDRPRADAAWREATTLLRGFDRSGADVAAELLANPISPGPPSAGGAADGSVAAQRLTR